MFSKKRKQQELATQKGLGIAVQEPQPQPQPQLQPWAPHERTKASSTTNSNAFPVVSPLRMTFDFELPPSPALSTNSPMKSSIESDLRPQTSDGLGFNGGKSGLAKAPPSLPPIAGPAPKKNPQAGRAQGVELEGSFPKGVEAKKNSSPPLPPPPQPPGARFDSDNVSSASSKSRRKSRIKSFFGFDPPPDIGAVSRPSSSSGTPKMPPLQAFPRDPPSRPATSGSGGPRMESSLFPVRQDPAPRLSTPENEPPVMTRAWLDARDKPYRPPSPAPKRPLVLQPTQSTPDLTATIRPTTANFSGRSPLTVPPDSPVSGLRPSPVSALTSPAGQLLQRPPSHAPSNYSGSTARTGISSKTTAVKDSAPVLTIGTPYQENSPTFPLPQHVTTRPKTAGSATATMGGVSVPTHHTSGLPRSADSANKSPEIQQKPTEKSERRKTRLLNPMALLSRRKSAQSDEAVNAEKAAQQAALARQNKVAAYGGVDKLPDNYDPRIRGSVVHDFNAPRVPKRVFSSNDVGLDLSPQPSVHSSRRGLQTANSSPFMPNVDQQGGEGEARQGPKLTFVRQSFHSNKYPSTDSSSTGRRTTGFFQEHLGDGTDSAGGIRAERLENKDFLQRASFLSQQSSIGSSSESAVLPVFARRSQHWDAAQLQGMGWKDDDSGSKRVSDANGQRDSGGSSMSAVSPVTASSGAAVGGAMGYDPHAGFSPVSPSSDKRESKGVSDSSGAARTTSGASSVNSRAKSGGGVHVSEAFATPFSNAIGAQPATEPIVEGSERESPRPPISITIPMPPPGRPPPQIPVALSGGMSPLSAINSPGVEFPSDAPTPEPQVAEAVLHLKAPTSPPKLVEKRASAVGHSSKRPMNHGMPKHHVSNASRFSFQLGESAAQEHELEEKARRMRASGEGVDNPLGDDDDDDDFFDEDAMDDLDEMEVQAQAQSPISIFPPQQNLPSMQPMSQQSHQRSGSSSTATTTATGVARDRASVAQFMYRPATTTSRRPPTSGLELQIDEGDSGESEDEDDEETPYWMHEDFMGYSNEQSRHTSIAESIPGAPPPATASGLRSRGMSASSGLTLDTSVGMNGRASAAAQTKPVIQPQQQQQPRPNRDSSGSERNQILSGMSFATTTIDDSGRIKHHTPTMSSSTMGGSSSSEARTISTGLGLSGFSDFRFSDSAPPSRPTSMQADATQPQMAGKENRRTTDSMTLPHDVDWTAESNMASPAMKQQGRSSDGSNVSHDATTGVALRPDRNARRASSPLALSKYGSLPDVDDDMYFDDGGFEQDVNGTQPTIMGEAVDESAFDDDNFLARNGNTGVGQAVQPMQPRVQTNHQRDTSAMTVTSLGSDGPYPSFAMPNPAKARQRDSSMLLEDLPLQTAPVDPRLIPRRNPSEDAKRLGLSNKVPPLPPQPGSQEAMQTTQTKMQAYHAALADAANRAAAEGRFLRAPSTKSAEGGYLGVSDGVPSVEDRSPQPSMTSAYSRGEDGVQAGAEKGKVEAQESQESTYSHLDMLGLDYSPPKLSFDFGFDSIQADAGADDDYDDYLNDDDIVAAANAEALASDDEGFYGQEFGFYAKARPNSSDLEAVNGGYFGPDGDDGLGRNKSTKEPNLTPITERSEFSTRNSFIGPFGPASAGPISAGSLGPGLSPALARLPFSPLGEGEVTSFDQLRKLRAHAFGGSNGSLQSDNTRGSQSSLLQMGNGESPTLSVRSSSGPGHNYFGAPFGGTPMALGYSTDSSGSGNHTHLPQQQQQHFGATGFSDSPHSAASSGHLPFSAEHDATPRRPLHSATEAPLTARKAPMANHSTNKVSSHSRNSSGADSVTYVKEESPNGPPRWVLERRRTSEQGQLELVAREFVKGGWI